MHRRDFLKTAAFGAATLAGMPTLATANAETVQLARQLPRWRGFNLMEMFAPPKPFLESDFQWISELGFDFVRLTMDYRGWTDANDPYKLEEKVLANVDQAVNYGQKYGIHVCLNLVAAPGYYVGDVMFPPNPPQKLHLWTDEEAQKQFDFQWSSFARRYRGIPSRQVSFNLVNEPAKITADAYCKVVRRAVAAIRREDPDRLIIADGLQFANDPVFDLADLGIAQSTHCYDPMKLTHYKTWVHNSDKWPKPTWPLKDDDRVVDRQSLFHDHIEPWKALEAKGVGVHVGEWGARENTPHDVVLAWARDLLGLWKDAGWGWAMWNFRGSFGILDSQRADVAYEDFHGHQLDRKLVTLMQQS
jgi:endoglucanase